MSSQDLLVNLLPYQPAPTGLSRYVERLLSAWQDATGEKLPTQLRLRNEGKAELASDAVLPSSQSSGFMRCLQANALVQHAVPVRRLVRKADPAVIYSPYTDRLLTVRDRPQVITCHDLIPLFLPSSRRANWRSRFWLSRHLQGATRVIAISEYVADLLVADGLPASRVVVIHNGVETVEDPIQSPFSGDCLLLARHARNKNIALALQGFAAFLQQQNSWQGHLVIVGSTGRETNRLQLLTRQLQLQERVLWFKHLSATDLEHQLRKSFCLLSTSLMEGFDYPLLEAQACGVPTLASRIPVHAELHSQASLLFDMDDQGASLAVALNRLANEPDLWQQLSHAGLSNARQLTLDKQCRTIWQLMRSLI